MAVRNLKNVAKDASKTPKSSKVKDYLKVRESLKSSLSSVKEKISEGNLSPDALKNAERFSSSLQDVIDNSYQIKSGNKKGEYPYSVSKLERSAKFADDVLTTGFDVANRKNEMFVRDINQASVGGVSTKSKEEVKVFYTMTRTAWDGYDIEERNKKILEYYNAESYEEVWKKVMNDPLAKKALEDAEKAQKKAQSEKDVADGSNDVQDEVGSPDYIKELILALDTQKRL